MKVLISGAGIAGPTLAYWLARYGFEPTLVERAPALRTGGYVIDFWGAGFEVARRMGVLDAIRERGYVVREVRIVNRQGRRVAGFRASVFARATGGAFVSVPRGDLAACLFAAIDGTVPARFGDSITRLSQDGDRVHVEFERHPPETFDLVIGADGLHSRVRELAFGPEQRFERYLGIKVAAFAVDGYRPRDELVYVMYSEVGQEADRFAMRDDRTMFLFTFADDDPAVPAHVEAQRAVLRRRFGASGWECSRILAELDRTSELYFDRVSQIEMPRAGSSWSTGQVALVGDAAFCISLLGGQGSALGMTAAYILAGELFRARGNAREAFAAYERQFAPFVARKQRAARRFASGFAPPSKMSMFLRNRLFDLLRVPGIASLLVRGGFADRIALPEYPCSPHITGA